MIRIKSYLFFLLKGFLLNKEKPQKTNLTALGAVLQSKFVLQNELLSKLQGCPKDDRGRISDLAPFLGSSVAIPLTDLQTSPTAGTEHGHLPPRSSPFHVHMGNKQRFCA